MILRRCLILLLLLTPSIARSQVVRGIVRDAAALTGLGGMEARLLGDGDSTVRLVFTDDNGRFALAASTVGRYSLDIRRVGYQRLTTESFTLGIGDTITLDLHIARTVTGAGQLLDTVRSEARRLSSATLGREQFRRHYLTGRGFFLSGWAIERSGLRLSEYLGQLDGLALTSLTTRATPMVPAHGGSFLTSTTGSRCLYARVDTRSLPFVLMAASAETLDDAVPLGAVMGVEVYRDRSEIPADWRMEGFVERLLYRANRGVEYLLGDTGRPPIDETMIASDSLMFGTRSATRGLVTDSRTRAAAVERIASTAFGDSSRTAIGTTRDSVRIWDTANPRPTGLVTRENEVAPSCGFLQIWTRASW